MASSSPYLFPQEGLDTLLNIYPRGIITVNSGTDGYVGLFSTSWTTIESYGYTNTNITLNSGTYPVAEITGSGAGGYSRIAVSGLGWGAPTLGTTVINANTINIQQSTYGTPLTFTCTSGEWTQVYGMFVATWSTVGGASNPSSSSPPNLPNVVIWYAPFADGNPVTLSSGDSLAITPTVQNAPYPM